MPRYMFSYLGLSALLITCLTDLLTYIFKSLLLPSNLLFAFVERTPNADLSEIFGTVDRGWFWRHRFGRPAAGAKNDVIAKPCALHFGF